MDLKMFFSPVGEDIYSEVNSISSFYKNVSAFESSLPEIAGHDIAIIGLEEVRGSTNPGDLATAADTIRKKLYSLKRGHGRYYILDLGNLRNGIDLDDTYKRIQEVGEYLITNNVLPIFIGGSHDLDIGQFKAYQGMDKLISMLNIDALLDMSDEGGPNQQHIQQILLHNPNYLFHYSHLAYQSYLIESRTMEVLEKLYFESYRVGDLHTNISEMEPVIRDADMVSFDISSIKSSDAPGSQNAQPFGLTGEEACQISWYAGMNEKLSSIGFYEYDPQQDDSQQKTASVIATMIWYFIEGFYNQKDHKLFTSNDYLKFEVSLNADPDSIVFFKSKLSEKWWMEVPYPEGKSTYARNCIVPCSYADYETASEGELPERYVSTSAKLT
jgi:formiminoglutamase